MARSKKKRDQLAPPKKAVRQTRAQRARREEQHWESDEVYDVEVIVPKMKKGDIWLWTKVHHVPDGPMQPLKAHNVTLALNQQQQRAKELERSKEVI